MARFKLKSEVKSNLNPIPVMGRDAFVAFANEWDQYLQSHGLYGRLSIPHLHKLPHLTVEVGLLVPERGAGGVLFYQARAHGWKVDSVDSDDSQSYFTGDNNGKGNKYWGQLGIDQLADCELSPNFLFLSIGNVGRFFGSEERLDQRIKNYYLKAEEITEMARKMIYERSALVSRDLFGNFSL